MRRFLVGRLSRLVTCRFTRRRRSAIASRFPSRSIAGCRSRRRSPISAPAPLELRMSRSSPGRYSLHDFAKNVYDVHAFGADGRELPTTRPDPYGWNVAGHGGSVTREVQGVRRSRRRHLPRGRHDARAHQHAGGDHVGARARRSAGRRVTLRAAGRHAAGRSRRSCIPGSSPLEFTAPNLQYLMDSPVGVRAGRRCASSRSARARFRFALHHTGTDAELDALREGRREDRPRRRARSTASIPEYEPGYYTFLADYLPYANGDGMEHRNSTVITVAGIDRARRDAICSTPSRTSSSTAGTSSASARRRSSRSTSIARTCPASSGSPKASRSTTARWRCSARGLVDLASTAATFGRPDRERGAEPRARWCGRRRR